MILIQWFWKIDSSLKDDIDSVVTEKVSISKDDIDSVVMEKVSCLKDDIDSVVMETVLV